MGVEVTYDADLRGFVIHDPRPVLSVALSTLTQAGPRPGVPVDTSSRLSRLALTTSGEMAAFSSYTLAAVRGGMPGVRERGGGFVWSTDDLVDEVYGWDVPNVITDWGWIERVSNVTATTNSNPHAITLRYQTTAGRNDTVLAACTRLVSSSYSVRVRKLVPGSAWATAATVTPDSGGSAYLNPCLLELPSGRILLFYWVVDTVSSSSTVQVRYSDDGGTTWTISSAYALETPVTAAGATAPGRLRAATNGRDIVLVGQVGTKLYQWASDSAGATFIDVDLTVTGGYPEVLPTAGGGFLVLYIETPSSTTPSARSIGTAFQPLTTVPVIDTSAGTGLDNAGEITAWAGDDGTFYLVQTQPGGSAAKQLVITRSVDDGATWSSMQEGAAPATSAIWINGDAGTSLTDFTACEQRGRGVLVTRTISDATFDDNSIAYFILGGSSSVTMPSKNRFQRDIDQVAWDNTWVAIDKPEDAGTFWTNTIGGGSTSTLGAGGETLDTTGSNDYYSHDYGVASDVDAGLMFEAFVQASAGGSTTDVEVGVILRLADGTDDYEVRIFIDDAGDVVVNDQNLGAPAGSAAVTQPFTLRACLERGYVSVFVRENSTSTARLWTKVCDGVAVTNNNATPSATSKIEWGNIANATATSVWSRVCVRQLPAGVPGLAQGAPWPDLFPRPFSPTPIAVDGGFRLAAANGPCQASETWTIATEYEHGVENINPAVRPSPRTPHRTTDTATAQHYVWAISSTHEAGLGPVVALVVLGANWRTGTFKGRDAGGVRTTLASVDLSIGAGLKALVVGDNCKPDPTNTSPASAGWIERNSLVGGSVKIAGSVYKITANTAGRWAQGTSGLRPTIWFDGDLAPSTNTAIEIWAPSAVVVVADAANYASYELVVDAQTTADGYLETGIAFPGPVALFGQAYSWGRGLELEANTELTTRRGGTRTARNLGPSRRAVDFGWPDAVDTSDVFSGNDPDYQVLSTTVVSAPADTPSDVAGLLDECNGPERLVVYLPAVDRDTAVQTFRFGRQFLYGRIVSSVRREVEVGDAGRSPSGEVVRINNIRVEEEL